MKCKLLFYVTVVVLFFSTTLTYAQVDIAIQNFSNGSPSYQTTVADKDGVYAPPSQTITTHVGTDNWDYTATTSQGIIAVVNSDITVADTGLYSLMLRNYWDDLPTIEFAEQDILNYSDVIFSIAYQSLGDPDEGEDLFLDYSYRENGVWIDNTILLHDSSDAETSGTPTDIKLFGTGSVDVSIPDTATSFRATIRATFVDGVGGNDDLFIDSVKLTGSTLPYCLGSEFTSPGAPTSCTYTYTSSGWDTVPVGDIEDFESVCILADVNFDLDKIDGTLYIAPGVTLTGEIAQLKGDVIVEGTLNLTNSPNLGSPTIYIASVGTLNITGNSTPNGSTIIQNAGNFNISGDLAFGGSSYIINFQDAHLQVQGDVGLSGTTGIVNCGILEVVTGQLNTSGSTTLQNECITYVYNDVVMSTDYTNNGVMVVDGTIDLDGNTFINNELVVVNNIEIDAGESFTGNDFDSYLIVRNNASLINGGSITNNWYFDISNPGDGFDTVCGTCTEDLDVLEDVFIPATFEEIVEDCGANIIINPIKESAYIDFDGVDDYLDSNFDFSGQQQATVMAWFKLDPFFSGPATIINQDGVEIAISNGKQLSVSINGVNYNYPSGNTVKLDEWTHVAFVFNSSLAANQLKLYFNGYMVEEITNPVLVLPIFSSSDLFTIGKKSGSNTNYFTGDIDEVRVFDLALTEDQISKIIYQEIENSSGSVGGSIVPKTIVDVFTSSTVPWANLKAYYPMTDIVSYSRTSDYSGNGLYASMHNIDTVLDQTAPMPFQSANDGNWNNQSNWLHGDVWNMNELTDFGYSIVKVSHNLTVNSDLKTLGMMVDSGKTITMNGTNEVNNSWYLGLDGTIDLREDSQLVQGIQSDLVTSADGKILRRQEGASSVYWYNYWASPVGSQSATSYLDNNASTNNPNNTAFTHNMLKEGTGSAVEYTNSYNEVGKVSTYWLYAFENGVTYYDWNHIGNTGAVSPGLGYTQKGTGVGTEQQYIFEGKPNNGTILINAIDTGGPGSTEGTTETSSLLGNPYPSAIDARQFITDNASGFNPVIDGTIRLWQQWAGNSHTTVEYEGGYAYINAMTTVRAAQYPYPGSGATPTSTKRPSFYIPVSQGFFVEVINNGDIEFNNGQRVFIKESDADENNPYVGSEFFKTSNPTAPIGTTEPNYQLLRLELSMSDTSSRTMVLGFDPSFTDQGREYGFDGGFITTPLSNDLGSLLNGDQYVIQALAPITDDKVVDLTFTATGTETYTIKSIEIANIDPNQDIYLRDNLLGIYHDLRNEQGYNFTSEAGTFNDRFDVVFNNGNQLSTDEFEALNETTIYYNASQETIFIKGLKEDIKQLNIYNALGQVILTKQNVSTQVLENGITINNLSTGLYIVSLKIENNQTIDKKIIIK